MIIRMDQPFANDHPDGPAFCKLSSVWAGLLQMIIWMAWPFANNLPDFVLSTGFFSIFLFTFSEFLIFLQQTSPSSSKHFFFSSNLRIKVQKQCFLVSSVRSSSSHPDPLLTQHHHPLFQITLGLQKRRKNCKCCPGHYLIVNNYSSI